MSSGNLVDAIFPLFVSKMHFKQTLRLLRAPGQRVSPILFIIYTLDLPSLHIKDHRIKVGAYAGEIEIYMSCHPSEKEEMEKLMSNSIYHDSMGYKWHIKLNYSKSCIMCFVSKCNARSCDKFNLVSKNLIRNLVPTLTT